MFLKFPTTVEPQLGALADTLPSHIPERSFPAVHLKASMTASGEIVTEDLKLIERLFYDFRKVLRR